MTSVIEEVDFVLLDQQLDDTPPCGSSLKAHQDPHDADWWTGAPCGDITPVCEARRRKAFADGGWQCVLLDGAGCRGWHEYDQLWFTPVRGS